MENDTIFRILLPVLITGFALHRGYYIKNQSKPQDDTVKEREEGLVSKIAGLLGLIGFAATMAYIVNPQWLAFANFSLPIWLRWTGLGIAILGFILLQWAQVTLANSWSDTPRMMRGQTLITGGPYKYIRHPIYTAFILILGSPVLISANWLIGLCWLGMTTLEVVSRIGFEESLMLEFFGNQYREYMKNTGRLLPKII
ncbi:MAG: isoprenylcysteine carboxylmethyltransferase family protein [Anaerolineales bacterium]|nr:isoprenylcysteine carboxylmethyltransferase family protein [Anaerolineales bacterium]